MDKLIEALTNASFLYGPFFFAILFMLSITRTAHSYYADVNKRTSPQASDEEKKAYRRYFYLTAYCGTVLVFISVGWWMYAQLQKHTFEGVILGLNPDQSIAATADDVYLRFSTRDAGEGRVIRDYRFAIVRNIPFNKGQTFHLDFYPTPGLIGPTKPDPVDLVIHYSGRARDIEKYRLQKSGASFQLIPSD